MASSNRGMQAGLVLGGSCVDSSISDRATSYKNPQQANNYGSAHAYEASDD